MNLPSTCRSLATCSSSRRAGATRRSWRAMQQLDQPRGEKSSLKLPGFGCLWWSDWMSGSFSSCPMSPMSPMVFLFHKILFCIWKMAHCQYCHGNKPCFCRCHVQGWCGTRICALDQHPWQLGRRFGGRRRRSGASTWSVSNFLVEWYWIILNNVE